MRKKLFTIVLLTILVISCVPKEAFCSDHFDTTPVHHHCGLTCHTCFNVIVPDLVSFQEVFKFSALEMLSNFSYQNPTMTRLKRPPICLS